MKRILSILSIGSIFLTSCSSYTINTYGTTEDDMYYTKAEARAADPVYHSEVQVQDMSKANSSSYNEQDQQNTSGNYSNYQNTNESYNNGSTQNPNYSNQQESYVDENGKTIINNYYGDVYDDDAGYYATRLQRFHRPYGGFGYYSPAYCGFYNDPYWNSGWNVGIGYSYGFGPSWSIGYGWGIGAPYGYYDPFFDPWFNPWYSPYYGYGGWGYNNSYAWGYRNGYWDGRNDNGYWNNGGYGGRSNTTVIRGPRPSRGGTVSTAGGRTVPTRAGVPNAAGNAENVRALPPSRNMPTNSAPANTTTESRPVPNTSPNGYVPPRLPNNTGGTPAVRDGGNTPDRNTLPSRNTNPNSGSETIIRNNPSTPAPTQVNPNYGGSRENGNTRSSSPAPVRVQPAPSRRSESSQPRYNAPSRSSAPSAAPSRSGGSSGGNSAPASRPRPR